MIQPERRTADFKTVLDILLNPAKPFPPVYLHSFSDLNPKELAALKAVWAKVPSQRRQSLLEDLEELADADTLVSFEEIGRMALTDEAAKVRALAIRLLWDVQERKLAPTYLKMLENDPDIEVRATAATALGTYVYLGEIEEIPASLLKPIEDSLLKKVNSQNEPLIRRRALESLGFSSRPEVPDLIRQAYDMGQPEWMESSLFAMGRSADKVWETEVLTQFNNPSDAIRAEAIQAAGELELASARLPMLQILEDEPENEDVWAAVVWSLSQIGGEDVRGTLEQLLEHTDDPDETDFLEEALDNLSFTEDMAIFNLLEVDPDETETRIVDSDGNLTYGDLPTDSENKKKKPKKTR
jgi:HEAT repeat protein